MSNESIRNWLNAVDEQGESFGWKDYKAYRARAINKVNSDEDRRNIIEYLEKFEE
jgi:hypothetical protein